jgi:hypothetical protein
MMVTLRHGMLARNCTDHVRNDAARRSLFHAEIAILEEVAQAAIESAVRGMTDGEFEGVLHDLLLVGGSSLI